MCPSSWRCRSATPARASRTTGRSTEITVPRDGQTVCYNDNIYNTTGIYRWFKDNVGTHKAAVFYYGLIAISADAGAFVQQGLKLEGYDVTGYDVNFANPNFDQAVQDMKNNGTDMILDVIDDGTNRKLCDTMQRYGLTVKAKVSTVVSYGDEIGTDFSDVCRNSIYISGNTMSYDVRSNPAVDEFRTAFDTYEPGAPLHQWSLEGWMAGQSLVEALNTMGAAPTRKGLEDWLRGLRDYTANGLSVPIDYTVRDYPNAPTDPSDCIAIAQWQDSKIPAGSSGPAPQATASRTRSSSRRRPPTEATNAARLRRAHAQIAADDGRVA